MGIKYIYPVTLQQGVKDKTSIREGVLGQSVRHLDTSGVRSTGLAQVRDRDIIVGTISCTPSVFVCECTSKADVRDREYCILCFKMEVTREAKNLQSSTVAFSVS